MLSLKNVLREACSRKRLHNGAKKCTTSQEVAEGVHLDSNWNRAIDASLLSCRGAQIQNGSLPEWETKWREKKVKVGQAITVEMVDDVSLVQSRETFLRLFLSRHTASSLFLCPSFLLIKVYELGPFLTKHWNWPLFIFIKVSEEVFPVIKR